MTCVIASTRPWNRDMAASLTQTTGERFVLIAREEDFSAEKLGSLDPKYVFLPHWSSRIPRAIYEKFEPTADLCLELPRMKATSK